MVVGKAAEGQHKVPMYSEVKSHYHETVPLPSHWASAATTAATSSCASWRRASLVSSAATAEGKWGNHAAKSKYVNATSRKLIYCLYETSHGTGGTKRSNRETITVKPTYENVNTLSKSHCYNQLSRIPVM